MRIRKRKGMSRSILHVVNRGARKASIFTGDEDRALFVTLMGRFALKHGVEIYSWCLMPNHYHLETETEGTPLIGMMHDLDGTYSQMFNKRHDLSGHLFQASFRSFAILDEEGPAFVSRYIHTNPVDLGISPEDYPWSSCRSYLGIAPVPPWLNPMPVLDWVGGPQKYRDYLAAAPPRRRKNTQRSEIMQEFLREYLRFIEQRLLDALSGVGESLGQLSVRTIVCWVAHRVRKVPAEIIADYYGYGGSDSVRALTGRFDQYLKSRPDLRALLAPVVRAAPKVRPEVLPKANFAFGNSSTSRPPRA